MAVITENIFLPVSKFFPEMTWHLINDKPLSEPTRATRTPAFWEHPRYPMIIQSISLIHIRSQIKTTKSQCYKFKKFAKKNQILEFCKTNLHVMPLLKLLDKMLKNYMDQVNFGQDKEVTWFHPQMDRCTRWNQYNPPPPPRFNFVGEKYNYGTQV